MLKAPIELKPQDIALNISDQPDVEIDAKNQERTWAIVGQEKAVKALEMGISIKGKGYNIFAVGESGIGKHTAIFDLLKKHKINKSELRDIAYVHNFQDPDRPIPLMFPGGKAREFSNAMSLLIDQLKDRVKQGLDSEIYKAKEVAMIHEAERKENKVLAEFEAQINAERFSIIHTEDDKEGGVMDIAPVIDGVTVPFEELQEKVSAGLVPEEVWTDTREQYFDLMNRMNRIHQNFKMNRNILDREIKKLRTETIRPGVEEECTRIAASWEEESIKNYLSTLAKDVIENIPWMEAEEEEESDQSTRYGVNIVLDRFAVDELPIIHETNPTKTTLFGSIEARYDVSGELRTNMMMIKAGSLLKADGGFLILQADGIFSKEGLWPEFKRVLKTRLVSPEIQSTPMGPLPILMKPEPITTETTVILVGSENIYESVCEQDVDFSNLFKITAEFSPVMLRNTKTEREYAIFSHSFAAKENLRPVSTDGVKEIIAYGIQLAERRNRLSTRFSLIGDLIRESDYLAGKEEKAIIDGKIVKKAIEYREQFSNLLEVDLLEQIKCGNISIDVDGTRIGAVNGMAILERGVYDFGIPLKISASVSPGKEGLINIERESGLSGEMHDKGVFLIEGYLRYRYARHQALALTAGIAVEQSYHEIDGDSASAAELAALLSAIAEVPLRQDIAITGAVNQQGEVQPVGGVQKKIQGFFQVCKDRGLTGRQGVIIPVASLDGVILSNPVAKALESGQFHVWLVKNIDEVITLLSGLDAGKEHRDGRFARNSVNKRIAKRLMEFAALS